ncbi:Hypothetical predicted protein [Pelobates cultripes]|uniref:Uncharacterized protein n=1 Tax=Pelobates cultripes TaxID=61616 RepID=A0AAD1TH33_PELCU|nr:Hypothetical predicted protein [Pelobates cultripes]
MTHAALPNCPAQSELGASMEAPSTRHLHAKVPLKIRPLGRARVRYRKPPQPASLQPDATLGHETTAYLTATGRMAPMAGSVALDAQGLGKQPSLHMNNHGPQGKTWSRKYPPVMPDSGID